MREDEQIGIVVVFVFCAAFLVVHVWLNWIGPALRRRKALRRLRRATEWQRQDLN